MTEYIAAYLCVAACWIASLVLMRNVASRAIESASRERLELYRYIKAANLQEVDVSASMAKRTDQEPRNPADEAQLVEIQDWQSGEMEIVTLREAKRRGVSNWVVHQADSPY